MPPAKKPSKPKKPEKAAAKPKAIQGNGAGAVAQAERVVLRFWGVRGSLASPGPDTILTGGNTSCVEVRFGEEVVIFDLGTGLRPLGMALAQQGKPVRASVFVSHYHYDHISGLPFFGPVYDPRCEFSIYGASRHGKDVRQILSGQMVEPYFPIPIGAFNARMRFIPMGDGETVRLGEGTVRAVELNHPGGALGFRLDYRGRSLVYATDFEHGTQADDRLVALARDADLLIFDAQFTPTEYSATGPGARKGWGHSTWEVGAKLAHQAGVDRLALYHHAPERSDEAIEALAQLARAHHHGAFAAREGMTLDL